MKKIILIALIILISAFSGSCAAKSQKANIPGLTDEIYKTLCGTWYFWFAPEQMITDEQIFGWGRGILGSESLVIDFTDIITPDIVKWYTPPAIVYVGDPSFKVLKISGAEGNIIKIDVKNEKEDQELTLVLHLNEDGSFWFEHNDNGHIPNGKEKIYKRISGLE